MGVERARRRERRGGRGDDGKDTRDAGGGGGVNGRGDRLRSANANKCQQLCARCVLGPGSSGFSRFRSLFGFELTHVSTLSRHTDVTPSPT